MKLLTKVWSKLVRYGWKNNKVWLGKLLEKKTKITSKISLLREDWDY